VALLLLAAMIAWPIGLLMWANSKLNHVDALSGASNTGGTTYLIAGSDSRGEDSDSHIQGARADTIMLLHVPESGPNALISLPRDIYVPIPGHNSNKINAAFSFGGAPLLVETVENLTNLTVDHYVEIGFSGVEGIVDAVGGVELCLDYSVKDKESKLDWEEGCHEADGETALAFARMRKKDPLGDIGRAERQRQVVSAVAKKLQSPGDLINPNTQRKLVDAGTGALVVSEGTGFVDLGKMALAFRKANSDGGVTGTPPIVSLNYRPGGVGSAVQLDEAGTEQFFKDVAAGTLEPGEYNSLRD
jgi:LCP family protein required for cell wall assembly